MTRAGMIELAAALAFGAVMTAIDYHAGPEPVFGVFSALALFLGMVVSMSMQENPVMMRPWSCSGRCPPGSCCASCAFS